MLLDGVLRRDAGVVVAGLKQHVEALHPARADDRVGERELERVAEMEVAGHVRRRVRDRRALAARIRVGRVAALLLPRPLPAFLAALRAVQRLHGAILRSVTVRSQGFTWIRKCE